MPPAVAWGTAPTTLDRWRAAVRAEPLENARPLPQRLVPLAQALGVRRGARYTTGPRTRRALALSGAAGATTGDVVHVASLPRGSGMGGGDPQAVVLRHELSHASRPRRRPRFLVPGASAHDADERAARLTGRFVPAAGGRLPRAAARVTTAQQPGPVISPGVVGSLPVLGVAPAVAPSTARTYTPPASLAPLTRPTRSAAAAVARLAAPPGADGHAVSFGPAAWQAADPASGTPEGSGTPGRSDEAAPHPASSRPQPLDLDLIMDGIGDRLLREIERRGGRWAETF